MMVELRKNKGMTTEEASRLIEDPLYLGVLMIKNGDADGEVSGADHATGDVLRPAFHYVKTAPGISVVSGAFIMILPEKKFGEDGVLFLLMALFTRIQLTKSLQKSLWQLPRQLSPLVVLNQKSLCLAFQQKEVQNMSLLIKL
jgi:hypothetical protein